MELCVNGVANGWCVKKVQTWHCLKDEYQIAIKIQKLVDTEKNFANLIQNDSINSEHHFFDF